jgi:hypothetical protein
MFLIFPCIMLGVFLLFYVSSQNRLHEEEARKAAEKAEVDAAESRRKAEAEANAQIAAQKRRLEAAAEEVRKEAERQAKWQAQYDEVKAKERTYRDEADQRSNEASELEVQLDSLHRERDELNEHYFDVLKQLELSRIKERNAELDIQRMITRIADRAENSQMTEMPPLPPVEQ